jgi:hypothetical protein
MRKYANEADYHQWFINHFNQLALPSKSKSILIVGHELSLFGGSKKGGSGSADLVAVDEEGCAWLIEAKIASSAEFNTVWEQLIRYRDSLQAHNRWDVLERQMLKFITGREKCKPASPIFQGCDTLCDVFQVWLKSIGKTSSDPEKLTTTFSEQIRTGTLGLAVLADTKHPNVIREALLYKHSGPKIYIVTHALEGIAQSDIAYFDEPGKSDFNPSNKEVYYDRSYPVCSVENLAEFLDAPLRSLVEEILYPGLVNLGWDGKDNLGTNKKSITFSINLVDKHGKPNSIRLVDVGWTDADASRVSKTQRLPGSFGLKVLFHPYDLHKTLGETKACELVNHWAIALHQCGWRGRGIAINIHKKPLFLDEFKKFAKEFEYQPTTGVKDFTVGSEQEKQALYKFLMLIDNIISDIRIALLT